MSVPRRFMDREEEFRSFTRKWIEKQDQHYREIEQEGIARRTKPIRHPKGQEHDRHSREFLWSDALWCQDVGDQPFVEFFYGGDDPWEDPFFIDMVDSQGCDTEHGLTWGWMTRIFEEQFRLVCSDIQHVLEE